MRACLLPRWPGPLAPGCARRCLVLVGRGGSKGSDRVSGEQAVNEALPPPPSAPAPAPAVAAAEPAPAASPAPVAEANPATPSAAAPGPVAEATPAAAP